MKPADAVPPRRGGGRRWPAKVAAWSALLTWLYFSLGGAALAAELRGHAKIQGSAVELPDNSLFNAFADDPLLDSGLDLRFNLRGRAGTWRWHADYQLLARRGDQLELQRRAPLPTAGETALPDDAHRVLDLTHRISGDDDSIAVQRLDRLYLSRATGNTVLSLGRQAVSWGNGLIYNPVDFFNPFDPAAIDIEYKTGDDMIYAQYLRDSGNDLQAVWVGRRDSEHEVSRKVSSLAIKYHGFATTAEYDLLIAEHYDARILSAGGSIDASGSIWRGDLMVTEEAGEHYQSLVVNWSYSWVGWARNMTGTVEYFHNGFGIDDGNYAPAALAANPALVDRIRRGELFTLGKNYLAAASTLELEPLWLLGASLFANLDDESALLQLRSEHDLRQDLRLLLALNLPGGRDGSEFGGIDSGVEGRPLAVDNSAFAQLAWYF